MGVQGAEGGVSGSEGGSDGETGLGGTSVWIWGHQQT